MGLSVRTCARRASVCPVHCGKTADRIRMPFSIMGRTGPGIRQVVQFGDRSAERGTFWGEIGARHCNQWELYGVRVRQRRDAALFPNYFGQTYSFCFMLLLLGEIKMNILGPLRQSPPVLDGRRRYAPHDAHYSVRRLARAGTCGRWASHKHTHSPLVQLKV